MNKCSLRQGRTDRSGKESATVLGLRSLMSRMKTMEERATEIPTTQLLVQAKAAETWMQAKESQGCWVLWKHANAVGITGKPKKKQRGERVLPWVSSPPPSVSSSVPTT